MANYLATLKDIPGVEGSFFTDKDGHLVAKEMPPLFSSEIFEELGRRIGSLFEALASQLGDYDEILLKMEGYWIYSKLGGEGILNVLSHDNMNYPALRMATTVAFNHINSVLQTGGELNGVNGNGAPAPVSHKVVPSIPKMNPPQNAEQEVSKPELRPAPRAAQPAPRTTSRPRLYRGRRIE